MGGAASVFLTCEEARLAIVFDLRSYGEQDETARAVLRALEALGGCGGAGAASGGGPLPVPGPEVFSGTAPGETFTDWATARIEWLLESLRPPPETLARLCSLVFGQAARAAPDPGGGPGGGSVGVLLRTGMEGFVCTRCGRCCLDLDVHLDCGAEDVALWRERGREDILAWVGEEQGPDGPVYRIWKYPGTPLYAESCPFLRRVPGDTAFVCAIHDVKPAVCRAYPGLRKHAMMTGCRGFPRD